MAWSLVDRTGPTRPPHETVAGYLHPRGAMVGELSPALSSRVRRLRGRAGKALSSRPRPSCLDPDHRTQHTRLGAQGEGTTSTTRTHQAPPRRTPMHTKKTTRKPPRSQAHEAHTLGVLRALISPSSNASLLPVYCSAPPSSSCGKLPEKGRALSPPSPRASRGPRESFLAPVQGDSFPQNQAPTLHDL